MWWEAKQSAVRRAASDEEDECEKAFEMAEDGGMGGTDGGCRTTAG